MRVRIRRYLQPGGHRGVTGGRRRLRARRRSRRQQRRPNPQPVGGDALPVKVVELQRRIVGPAGLDDVLGAARRGPERSCRTVRDRFLLLLHAGLCRTLWSGRKRARARCASSSAPARRPSPRSAPRRRPAARRPRRLAAPQRRGASPAHAHREGRGAATRWAARNRSLRDQIRRGLRAPRPQGVPGGARPRTRAEGDQEPAARQPSEADHRVALRIVQIIY